MKNWTQRFAIFAVLGAILSSAMLVGCGSGEDTTTTNTTDAAGNTTSTTTTKDED